jgi:hypothetical protein
MRGIRKMEKLFNFYAICRQEASSLTKRGGKGEKEDKGDRLSGKEEKGRGSIPSKLLLRIWDPF